MLKTDFQLAVAWRLHATMPAGMRPSQRHARENLHPSLHIPMPPRMPQINGFSSQKPVGLARARASVK
jgi:hypothetical protein